MKEDSEDEEKRQEAPDAPPRARHTDSLKYRADIDGLRAVAVLAVVGFHAFPQFVRSGFIGVDIFFCISGYLISSIIIHGLRTDRFSFAMFYARRIRRIFPALIVVLTACYAFGWIILLPDEFSRLGRHIVAGAGFLSNFELFQERGYFDHAADTKPLLHLWSLGIEEQFYIFWPAMLLICFRLQIGLFVAVAFIFVASFAHNIFEIHSQPVATFYLPHARIWELASGGLLAAATIRLPESLPAPKQRDFGSTLGGALILAGLLVTEMQDFPGWWPILPLTGVVLIIAAGPQALLSRRILSNPVLVWFGLISFPLYLWHWPLLSFARILTGDTPAPEIRIGAVVLAIVLAWLTTRLIETPLRFGGQGRVKTATLVVLMFAVGLGGYGLKRGGLAFRDVVHMNADPGFEGGDGGILKPGCGIDNPEQAKLFANCLHDPREEPKYALLGDSKAAAISFGLVRTSSERGRWLFIGGSGGTPQAALVPILSENPIYPPEYSKLTAIALKAVADNKSINKVVLVTGLRALFQLTKNYSIEDLPEKEIFYDAALQGLGRVIDALVAADKRVTILIDNPTLPHPEDCWERQSSSVWINVILLSSKSRNPLCYPTIERHLQLQKRYRDLLTELALRGRGQVTLFDTIRFMCDLEHDVCPPAKNGHRMYSYTDHISDYAAGLIGKDLNAFLADDRGNF